MHLCVVRCIIQVRVVKQYVVTYPENPTGALTAFLLWQGPDKHLGPGLKRRTKTIRCTSTCSRTEPRHGSTEGTSAACKRPFFAFFPIHPDIPCGSIHRWIGWERVQACAAAWCGVRATRSARLVRRARVICLGAGGADRGWRRHPLRDPRRPAPRPAGLHPEL